MEVEAATRLGQSASRQVRRASAWVLALGACLPACGDGAADGRMGPLVEPSSGMTAPPIAGAMNAKATAAGPQQPVAPVRADTAFAIGTREPGPAAELGLDECLSTGTLQATLRPANLLFLIDRSASLNCNLPPITDSASCEAEPKRADPSQPSKWEVVRQAVSTAIAELPPSASAAITYFNNDDRCGVQSLPHVPMGLMEPAQHAALTDSLKAVSPRGGTPIVGGLVLAYKQLNPDQTPNQPFGNRFVVLITDGEEGCAPEETSRLLEQELPKSRQARVITFVVGVPGSEVNRAFLSRLAFAGGAPSTLDCDHESQDEHVGDCHFDMTRESDLGSGLREALASITQTALGCEFDLPDPEGSPVDYERVNVVYTDIHGEQQLVGQDAQRACDGGANGWQYNEDRSQVLICGDACERVRRAASIRIALGCRSILVQ